MRFRSLVVHLPLALVLAFAVTCGIRGVDFGYHWDETKILRSVARSVRSATILPGWYNYPSLSYGLAMAGVAPEAASALGEARAIAFSRADKGDRKARLAALADDLADLSVTTRFKIRVRVIFVLVSLLSVVWVYAFVYLWRRSWIEALTAAALLALSWEVGYHARWIAPDTVLMQFAALTILAAYVAAHAGRHGRLWLVLSTVVAGLACGTKYTGAVLFLPVAILAFTAARREGRTAARALGYAVVPLTLLFVAVFLVTTPGAVLQPFRFAYDLVGEMRHYRTGHVDHTITPGILHAYQMLVYVSLSAFSRYWPISLVVCVLAVIGSYDVFRRHRSVAVVLLLVPAVYVLYLCLQRVMIVRNLLLVMPFLAILSARGAAMVTKAVPLRAGRVLLAIVFAAMLAANGVWLAIAAESIVHRSSVDHGGAIEAYLGDHPDETFFLSLGAYHALRERGGDIQNVTVDPGQADRFVIMTSDLTRWFGNRFHAFGLVSGTFEVNLDYYASWSGDPKVFVVGREAAEKMWFARPAQDETGSTP